ncbi:uncharacterized protein [Patagioenas fasciata]|uniref:uncharacterized protein n=1 Tax=Patagioenas fasciata TaxID=372321 RepID=UPI003A9A5F49
MALAQRLLPLLLLLVALHARTAQAAPLQAQGADRGGGPDQSSRLAVGLEPLGRPGPVPVGQGDPGSHPGSRMEAPGDAVDVPVGRTFPAPRLDAGLQPGWRRRGLPRPKYQAEGGKKPPEASEFRKQILKELQGGHDTDRKAVQKEAFPEGSSHSLPVPGGKLEGMRDTGRPGNCCPVISRCHPLGPGCGSRLFPQCPLLHVTSAAKAESVLSWGPLDPIPQMVGNGTLLRMYLPL